MKAAPLIAMALAPACLLAAMLVPAAAGKLRGTADDYYITVPSAKDPAKTITGLVRYGPHGDQWERRERYRWADGRPG